MLIKHFTSTDNYHHVGVIATPPRTVEDIVKQRQRRKTLTDDPMWRVPASSAH